MARVIGAVAKGDLSKSMALDIDGRPLEGEFLRTAKTVNRMVDQLGSFASEVTRVAREVGTDGKLGGQAEVKGVAGTWKDLTDSVNSMAGNLTGQVRNIADVTKAVAAGDLSKKITVDVKGEILELKNTINTMVDQLGSFASEVTRVAREVGTEGKLGGQAEVKGVAGTWKDLTDTVNFMAGNLTNQVRGIAKVVTAVANGDLDRKLTVEAKGEIVELADTINGMIDTLATFADQVTTVAREVGVEGKLGGQASVPGAAGTWKHLTDNVNQLAANLTTQVRAIAEVSTAVTTGDLTRSIAVEARGEVAALKDNINEMIRNLRETTSKNSEQDWLKTNLAKFTRMLQGQKDLLTVAKLILSELAPVVGAQHGVFYIVNANDEEARLDLLASYAYRHRKNVGNHFELGEGLVGQAALEKEKIVLTNVPGDYIQIGSGLGEAPPLNIIVLPVLFEGNVKAVMELASFEHFSATHQMFLGQLMESIGIVLNTIEANSRTEDLLAQSQSLANELQSRQQELQQTNAELEEKATLLARQNVEVERKNAEVEQARQALEEKASQLALTSKYKSEFLANMSHELRTPLNSLLILADQLSGNPDGNLTLKQVEFARTIHASGKDLLKLINDILDLAKIESGTVAIEVGAQPFGDLQDYLDRTFRPVADSKGLDFTINLAANLPRDMRTDSKRLHQILRNLLSNAFKFTDAGSVTLDVGVATEGWTPHHYVLDKAERVIMFRVHDTGIGIQPEKQQIIFEAFQQADGSTSRRYGGTGLGLAISREIARLLGGEIALVSTPGEGSTFHLYMPQAFVPTRAARKERGAEPAPAPHAAESRPAPETETITATEALDDRESIVLGDKVLLIVEDDEHYGRVLLDLAHASGWKGLLAQRGAAAVSMARERCPDAITLDISLPDIDGWRVLALLKQDLETRHIPVHVLSVHHELERALGRGARAVLTKPTDAAGLLAALTEMREFVERPLKNLLLVQADDALRAETVRWIGNGDVRTTALGTATEALRALQAQTFDCMVVDPGLPDIPGLDLVAGMKRDPARRMLPVIVYSPRALAEGDDAALASLTETGVRTARSPEELFDATALFLHRATAGLPEAKRRLLEERVTQRDLLAGRKVLIVDDDIRNIFAMTSVLERQRMAVVSAENGRDALTLLRDTPGVAVVLMDIMLPEMDGYQTMRAMREMPEFSALPIIALTAKAMKGDREKCLAAGASDYIAKPVETDRLLATLTLWLQP
jgi:hypothetical protein